MATRKPPEPNRRSPQPAGPNDIEHKPISLKPLRHVLSRHAPLLPHEDPEKFGQLCDQMEAEWQPQSRTQQLVLEHMVMCSWKLSRVTAYLAALEQDPTEQSMKNWERLMKYQSQLRSSFSRSVRGLQRLQKFQSRRNPRPRRVAPVAAPAPAATLAELPYLDFAYHDTPPPGTRIK